MRCEGSSIISFQCAIQPAVRAIAYSTVNISVGKPSAFNVIAEEKWKLHRSVRRAW
jgi:hypothetical protein